MDDVEESSETRAVFFKSPPVVDDSKSTWSDRLWSIGVFVTCFLYMAFSVGAAASTSVLVVEYLKYFRETKFTTSWCSAVCLTLSFATAPVGLVLLRFLTHRHAMMLAVTVSTVGLFASASATQLYHLYLTVGLLLGFGYGLMDYVSTVYTSEYFTTHRFLIVGLRSSGSGFGNMLIPLLLNRFIELYTWRGAQIILAGITCQLIVPTFFVKQIENFTVAKTYTVTYNEKTEYDQRNSLIDLERINQMATVATNEAKNCVVNVTKPNNSIKTNVSILFRTWQLYAFTVNLTLSGFCVSVFFTFNMDYFISVGIERSDAVFLLLLVGIGNVSSRVITGVFSHFVRRRIATFCLIADVLLAIFTVLIAQLRNYGLYAVTSFVIGMSHGSISACTTLVSLELFGTSLIRESLAISLMAYGTGALIGPPIGGLVFDSTQDYGAVFKMCSGISLLSAVSILPVICASLSCFSANKHAL